MIPAKPSCKNFGCLQDFFKSYLSHLVNKHDAVILIDGSNFYFKLKSLGIASGLNFNFSHFVQIVSKDKRVRNTTYYVGKIRTDGTTKSKQLHGQQQKLLSQLKKHAINYKLGYLLKQGGKYHEKGVDVQLAVDIVVTAYEGAVSHIILVSSDTDLIPAIVKAKELGVSVEYIGFNHQKSKALMKACKQYQILNAVDLKSC